MFEITPNEIIIPLLAVGLAEMGDKTQLSIFLGKYLSSRIDRRVISRVAGVVFLLIGLSFLLSVVASSAFADTL